MTDRQIFSVPGISCEHCERAIKEEVTPLGGVRSVDVDIEGKVVAVAGDSLDTTAILAAIAEAGYEATAL